jgi:protein-disulfide isomerase-like protein with CxxC motif
MRVVFASYYTDPCCPWSWALEPALRKLIWEFGGALSLTYVMCGMAQEFGDPLPLVEEMLAASAASGMPVDARLWLDDPPRSSHPACVAVKAAADQGDPAAYLRRLREGVMCRRRRIDETAALVDLAREAGLDVERFRVDLGSHGTLEAFAADLERASSVPPEHYAEGSERVKLPSLEFSGDGGELHGVYGPSSYEKLREAAVAAGAAPAGDDSPPPLEALGRFGTMSTAEVAVVCDLPGPRAPAELWRLATDWRVRPERLGSGELWSVA